MEKNTHKKQDAKGNKLSEAIGKGINKKHLKKVLDERQLFISVRAGESRKAQFIASCKILEISQSDALNIAIDTIIKKAVKL